MMIEQILGAGEQVVTEQQEAAGGEDMEESEEDIDIVTIPPPGGLSAMEEAIKLLMHGMEHQPWTTSWHMRQLSELLA